MAGRRSTQLLCNLCRVPEIHETRLLRLLALPSHTLTDTHHGSLEVHVIELVNAGDTHEACAHALRLRVTIIAIICRRMQEFLRLHQAHYNRHATFLTCGYTEGMHDTPWRARTHTHIQLLTCTLTGRRAREAAQDRGRGSGVI